MKILKKIVMILVTLTVALQCVACGSCKSSQGGNSAGGGSGTLSGEPDTSMNTPTGTVSDVDAHYVSNTLHKVEVTETQTPFVQNGKSEYVLVCDPTTECYKAAGFISDHVYNATGYRLPTESDENKSYSADKKWIVVGSAELFAQAGLTMPTENLGSSGYYIISKDNSVFIATLDSYAIRNAAISFLSHVVGYEMYAEDSVSYWKDGATLPNFNIIERPDFDYVLPSSSMTAAEAYGMGYTPSIDVFMSIGQEAWHNSLNFFTQEQIAKNPSWFSLDKSQLCYTARGDAEAYSAMQSVILDGMMNAMNTDPNKSVITLTVEDGLGQDICACEWCKAEELKYGTESAAIIKFVNDLADKLKGRLEQQAAATGTPVREVVIYFFAYFNSVTAPVKQVGDSFQPIDESVVCRDNVGVYLVPTSMRFNKNLYTDAVNAMSANTIKGWSAVTKNIFYWLYDTNFMNYFYPFNSYDVLAENYRFCKENASEISLMHNQSQYNQTNVTAFGRLKTYIHSKHCFNVNASLNETLNSFFTGYFKETAVPMRQFFDELQAHLEWMEDAYPTDCTGDYYDYNVDSAHLWPQKTLDHWLDLIDEAYAAVKKYETTNPSLYATLCENIKLESLFPRFALIQLYPATYSDLQLYDARKSFVEDCRAFSITNVEEHVTIDGLFTSWGF